MPPAPSLYFLVEMQMMPQFASSLFSFFCELCVVSGKSMREAEISICRLLDVLTSSPGRFQLRLPLQNMLRQVRGSWHKTVASVGRTFSFVGATLVVNTVEESFHKDIIPLKGSPLKMKVCWNVSGCTCGIIGLQLPLKWILPHSSWLLRWCW